MRDVTFGGGYASPPLAQTAKVNVDFSEIDHLGSGGSTGDRCLQDTGEGGFGRCAPRANLVFDENRGKVQITLVSAGHQTHRQTH